MYMWGVNKVIGAVPRIQIRPSKKPYPNLEKKPDPNLENNRIRPARKIRIGYALKKVSMNTYYLNTAW